MNSPGGCGLRLGSVASLDRVLNFFAAAKKEPLTGGIWMQQASTSHSLSSKNPVYLQDPTGVILYFSPSARFETL